LDVDQALKVIDQAIRDANVTVYDIAHLIPSGDSSRIPKLHSLVKERFPSAPLIHEGLDPRLLTTYGAAIQGSVLVDDHGTVACFWANPTLWQLGRLRLSCTLFCFI
jgi:molecular chaperone DnaK (HSP70)